MTKPDQLIPYTYREKLTGAIHKWIGTNDVHDEISLYSFSNLEKGEKRKDGFAFNSEVNWFISAHNNQLISSIINGVFKDTAVCYGMAVKEITIEETPDLSNIENFKLANPVFIKRNVEGEEINLYLYKKYERFSK